MLADCPAGKEFPANATNFDCYAHPHAEVGTLYIAGSLMLGILICLCGVVVWHVLFDDRT